MEQVKRFRLIDVIKALSVSLKDMEISDKQEKFENITNKEFEKAGVTKKEIEELRKSLEDPVMKKYGKAEPGNRIYDQGQKMAKIEEERKERNVKKQKEQEEHEEHEM
jgi:hypothetical protein